MRGLLLWLVLLLFLPGCSGCLLYPRVMQCRRCGDTYGMVGGLLPGDGSRCDCGGTYRVVRTMTQKEWREAKRRGFVTLQDGEPTGNR